MGPFLFSIWPIFITPFLQEVGYIAWYEGFDSGLAYGFFALLPSTVAAIINSIILLILGGVGDSFGSWLKHLFNGYKITIHGEMRIGNRRFRKGDEVPWIAVYPFFLLHILLFAITGFWLAYAKDAVLMLYLHGGLAIFGYTFFYIEIFGLDEVKWMFINAGLGIVGIYTQLNRILSLFGKTVEDYPIYIHVIPCLYFVIYTFLIRQALLDITHARKGGRRKQITDCIYVAVMLLIYFICY